MANKPEYQHTRADLDTGMANAQKRLESDIVKGNIDDLYMAVERLPIGDPAKDILRADIDAANERVKANDVITRRLENIGTTERARESLTSISAIKKQVVAAKSIEKKELLSPSQKAFVPDLKSSIQAAATPAVSLPAPNMPVAEATAPEQAPAVIPAEEDFITNAVWAEELRKRQQPLAVEPTPVEAPVEPKPVQQEDALSRMVWEEKRRRDLEHFTRNNKEARLAESDAEPVDYDPSLTKKIGTDLANNQLATDLKNTLLKAGGISTEGVPTPQKSLDDIIDSVVSQKALKSVALRDASTRGFLEAAKENTLTAAKGLVLGTGKSVYGTLDAASTVKSPELAKLDLVLKATGLDKTLDPEGYVDKLNNFKKPSLSEGLDKLGKATVGVSLAPNFQKTSEMLDKEYKGFESQSSEVAAGISASERAASVANYKQGKLEKNGEVDFIDKVVAETGSALQAVQDTWDNPVYLESVVSESAPSMIAPMALTSAKIDALTKGMSPAAKAVFLSSKEGKEAVGNFASKAGIHVGAAQEAASNSTEINEKIRSMSPEQLAQSPIYNELIKSGYTPEEAKFHLADVAGKQAFVISYAVSAAASWATGAGKLEGTGFGLLDVEGNKNLIDTSVTVVLNTTKETFQEVIESAGGTVGQNVGEKVTINPDKDITEGTGDSGGIGGLAGATTAAVMSTVANSKDLIKGGTGLTKEGLEVLFQSKESKVTKEKQALNSKIAESFDVTKPQEFKDSTEFGFKDKIEALFSTENLAREAVINDGYKTTVKIGVELFNKEIASINQAKTDLNERITNGTVTQEEVKAETKVILERQKELEALSKAYKPKLSALNSQTKDKEAIKEEIKAFVEQNYDKMDKAEVETYAELYRDLGSRAESFTDEEVAELKTTNPEAAAIVEAIKLQVSFENKRTDEVSDDLLAGKEKTGIKSMHEIFGKVREGLVTANSGMFTRSLASLENLLQRNKNTISSVMNYKKISPKQEQLLANLNKELPILEAYVAAAKAMEAAFTKGKIEEKKEALPTFKSVEVQIKGVEDLPKETEPAVISDSIDFEEDNYTDLEGDIEAVSNLIGAANMVSRLESKMERNPENYEQNYKDAQKDWEATELEAVKQLTASGYTQEEIDDALDNPSVLLKKLAKARNKRGANKAAPKEETKQSEEEVMNEWASALEANEQEETVEANNLINHSGGAKGSDTAWGVIGQEFGVNNHNHYYYGNKTPTGNTAISEEQYQEGLIKAKEAAKALGRNWSLKPFIQSLLARNWQQVKNADAIFAIVNGFEGAYVSGGTGYAVAMAIAEGKPVYVFGQQQNQWYKAENGRWVAIKTPVLTRNFAGIGTRELNENGRQAIRDVYDKTLNREQKENDLSIIEKENTNEVTTKDNFNEYEDESEFDDLENIDAEEELEEDKEATEEAVWKEIQSLQQAVEDLDTKKYKDDVRPYTETLKKIGGYFARTFVGKSFNEMRKAVNDYYEGIEDTYYNKLISADKSKYYQAGRKFAVNNGLVTFSFKALMAYRKAMKKPALFKYKSKDLSEVLKNPNLLAQIENEIEQGEDSYVFLKDYTTEEVNALALSIQYLNEIMPEIDSFLKLSYTQGDAQLQADSMVKDNPLLELTYQNEKGEYVLDDSVKLAIGVGILQMITEEEKTTALYNDDKGINKVLGRLPDHPVSLHEMQQLQEIGQKLGFMSQIAGETALEVLGLKVNSDVKYPALKDRLEIAMGAIGFRALANLGYMEIVDYSTSKLIEMTTGKGYIAESDTAKTKSGKAVYKGGVQTKFVRITSKGAKELSNLRDTLGSENQLLHKVFGVSKEKITNYPTREPVVISNKIKRTDGVMPAEQQAKIQAHANQEHTVSNMSVLWNMLPDEVQNTIAGVVTGDKLKGLHLYERLKLKAANEGLLRELAYFRDFVKKGVEGVFFLSHETAKNSRMDIPEKINVQGSKVHRWLLVNKAWRITVDSLFLRQLFKVKVAAAFGASIDTTKNKDLLDKFDQIITNPIVVNAVQAYRNIESGNATEADYSALIEGVNFGEQKLHTLAGIKALAAYHPTEPFEEDLALEVDGKTNGFMIGLLQMYGGHNDEQLQDLLKRGGISNDNENLSALQILDSYQTIAKKWGEINETFWSNPEIQEDFLEDLQTALTQQIVKRPEEFKAAMNTIMKPFIINGLVTKFARNLAKSPLMVWNYNAGLKSMVLKFINDVLEAEYKEFAKLKREYYQKGVSKARKQEIIAYYESKSAAYTTLTGMKQVITLDNADNFILDGMAFKNFVGTVGYINGNGINKGIEQSFPALAENRKKYNFFLKHTFDVYGDIYNSLAETYMRNNDVKYVSKEAHLAIMRVLGQVKIKFPVYLSDVRQDKVGYLDTSTWREFSDFDSTIEFGTEGNVVLNTKSAAIADTKVVVSYKNGLPVVNTNGDGAVKTPKEMTLTPSFMSFDQFKNSFTGVAPVMTHSIDAHTMTGVFGQPIFNIHDAIVVGGKDIKQIVMMLNESFFEVNYNYSMLESAEHAANNLNIEMTRFYKDLPKGKLTPDTWLIFKSKENLITYVKGFAPTAGIVTKISRKGEPYTKFFSTERKSFGKVNDLLTESKKLIMGKIRYWNQYTMNFSSFQFNGFPEMQQPIPTIMEVAEQVVEEEKKISEAEEKNKAYFVDLRLNKSIKVDHKINKKSYTIKYTRNKYGHLFKHIHNENGELIDTLVVHEGNGWVSKGTAIERVFDSETLSDFMHEDFARYHDGYSELDGFKYKTNSKNTNDNDDVFGNSAAALNNNVDLRTKFRNFIKQVKNTYLKNTGVTGTEAFKKWFGKSVIVDKNGSPLRMYHGTTRDFNTFKSSKQTNGLLFFTDDPKIANHYASDGGAGYATLANAEILAGFKAISNQYPEYHSEGNLVVDSDIPTDVLFNILYDLDILEDTHEIMQRLEKGDKTAIKEGVDKYNRLYDEYSSGGVVMPVYIKAENPAGSKENPIDWLEAEKKGAAAYQAEGYDSVYVTEQGGVALAVFKPTQIKSAVGNSGFFSEDDPSILGSSAGGFGNFTAYQTETIDTVAAAETTIQELHNNDFAPTTDEHFQYLKGLLGSVTTAIQPVVLMLGNAIDGTLGNYQASTKTIQIKLRTIPATLLRGMSAAETFAHEMIHHVVYPYLDKKNKYTDNLRWIWEVAAKYVKPEHFLPLDANGQPVKNPTYSQKKEAILTWRYIFQNSQSSQRQVTDPLTGLTETEVKHNGFHEFVAHATTNLQLIRVLRDNIQLNEEIRKGRQFTMTPSQAESGLFQRLGDVVAFLAHEVMEYFYVLSNKVFKLNSASADKVVLEMVRKMIDTNQKANLAILAKMQQAEDNLNSRTRGWITSAVQSNFTSKVITGLGKVGNAVPLVAPVFKGAAHGLQTVQNLSRGNRKDASEFVERMHRNLRLEEDSIIGYTYREMQGFNDRTGFVHKLKAIRSRFIDAMRENTQANIISYIRQDLFKGNLAEAVNKAMYYVVGKADLQSLNYTAAELIEVLTDNKKLSKRIKDLKKELEAKFPDTFNYYIKHADSLGHYMQTGKALEYMPYKNAYTIARLINAPTHRSKVKNANEAEKLIDELATLYALDYADTTAKELVADALTNNPEAVQASMEIHRKALALALKENFEGNKLFTEKGYVGDVTNPKRSLVFAYDYELNNYLAEGYVKVYDNRIIKDKYDDNKVEMFVLVNPYGSLNTLQGGSLSTTNNKARGTNLIQVRNENGKNLPMNDPLDNFFDGIDDINTYLANIGGEIDAQFTAQSTKAPNANILFPSINDKGKVINLRYQMLHSTKVDALQLRDNFDESMAYLVSHTKDKRNTTVINRLAAKAVFDDFTKYSNKEMYDYVFIGKDSQEKEYRDLWFKIPYDARQEFESLFGQEGLFIRKRNIDNFFGQRELRSKEIFAMINKRFNDPLTKALVTVANKTTYRKYEDGFFEAMKMVKDTIVIKFGTTAAVNIFSNAILVGLKTGNFFGGIADTAEGFKYATQYMNTLKNLERVKLQLSTKKGLTASEKRGLLSDKLRMQDELYSNPVGYLIKQGVFQTIVEDLDSENEKFAFSTELASSLDKYTNKVPAVVKDVFKFALITHDTRLYKFMHRTTQLSDFAARYALFKHNESRGMKNAENIKDITETFVDYSYATHPIIAFLNNTNFLMFTKYGIRIQKILFMLLVEKPFSLIMLLGSQGLFGDIEDPMDAAIGIDTVVQKFGTPITSIINSFGETILTAPITD